MSVVEGVQQEQPVQDSQQEQNPEQQAAEQEAIKRYKESLKTQEEIAKELPDDYEKYLEDSGDDAQDQEGELIAGKFKSQEELLKAYKELEKKLGSQQKESKEEPMSEAERDEVKDNVEKKGLDLTQFEKEFSENGELSEESYKLLEEKGFPRDQVDRYISGQMYYAESVRNKVLDMAGGEDGYKELVSWAAENMDEDFIEDYNDTLNTGDFNKIKRNIEYLKFKYSNSEQRPARRIEGESGGTGLKPFRDKNEWQRAASDRLYGKDAKYTNMVDQRYLLARRQGIL